MIGGDKIRYGPNGKEFMKGDVGEIYRERKGVEWDGDKRFGLGPYVQRKTSFDWIAKARGGSLSRRIIWKNWCERNCSTKPNHSGVRCK